MGLHRHAPSTAPRPYTAPPQKCGGWHDKAPPRNTATGLSKPGARDRVRTGDPQLGKLMLYQLSYSRVARMVADG